MWEAMFSKDEKIVGTFILLSPSAGNSVPTAPFSTFPPENASERSSDPSLKTRIPDPSSIEGSDSWVRTRVFSSLDLERKSYFHHICF